MRFTPAKVPTIAFLIVFPLLLSLGYWQLQRADYKRGIEQAIHNAQHQPALNLNQMDLTQLTSHAFYPVKSMGHYDNEHQYLLDNRTFNGRAGYHVYTPFILKNTTQAILVNRGWLTYKNERLNIPNIDLPSSPMLVMGRLKHIPQAFVLADKTIAHDYPRIIQQISLQSLSAELGYEILPMIIELDKTQDYGFIREWPGFYGSVDKHLSYAVQWFAMAFVLLIIFISLNLKKTD